MDWTDYLAVWFAAYSLVRKLQRSGVHGKVALAVVATLPDGQTVEAPLPPVTI